MGDAEIEKSATKTVSGSEALCVPLVPVTVKLSELPLNALRLLTVKVLLWPGTMEPGLKAQAADVLPEHASMMAPPKP